MTLDEIAAVTDEEAAAKVAELRETYKAALATNLLSDGNISPHQIGLMSDRQRRRYQENAQTHMTVRRWIDELQRPRAERQRDAAARASAAALEADRRDLLSAVRRVEDGCNVGVGRRGKLTPTWAAIVQREQATIRAVLERHPDLASAETARALAPEAMIAATAAAAARRGAGRAGRGARVTESERPPTSRSSPRRGRESGSARGAPASG